MANTIGIRDVSGGTPFKIRDLHSANEHTQAIFEDNAAGSTTTNVPISTASGTLKAANSSRRGFLVYNNSSLAACLLHFGAGAASTLWTTRIEPQSEWRMPRPVFYGAISAITDASTGHVMVTELT